MPNPRSDYSNIYERPRLTLPGNARIAVWVIINVEEWDINEPMARTILPVPQGRSVVPDIPNYAWYDYGMRVGFWRLKRVLDRHGIPATISLNAAVCHTYPHLVQECVKSGWELLGHGYQQRVLNAEADQRDVIRRSMETIREFSGSAPRGWMGPGLAETLDTPDILAEEGIEYVCDWCNDDQPYPMKVKSGSLVSIPYTLELNDIPIYAVQHHRSPEIFRARPRPVRHPVPGGRRERSGHGHFHPPLHHRRPPPHQVLRHDLRLHQAVRGRGVYEGQRDSGLV